MNCVIVGIVNDPNPIMGYIVETTNVIGVINNPSNIVGFVPCACESEE